jgi:2-keto-4-pentenoate hydratase
MKRHPFARTRLVLALSTLSLAPLLAAPPVPVGIDQLVEDYLARREAHGFGKRLTMSEAYLIQSGFVKRLQPALGKPVGYKVGLVTREAQQRYGVEAPLRGVLLENMLLASGVELPADFGVRPILEADLIVVVKDKAISKARSIVDVAEHLKDVVAFIELPDSFMPTNPPPDGALIAAGNVGARLGVLGQRLPVRSTAEFIKGLAEMTVTIRDQTGAELGRGQGKVILDQPLNAVLWLMEELHRDGKRLMPGDLISLGSIKAIPPPAGKTVTVRYDGLPGGPIEASVRFR